jgi:hypothetical protein
LKPAVFKNCIETAQSTAMFRNCMSISLLKLDPWDFIFTGPDSHPDSGPDSSLNVSFFWVLLLDPFLD